MFLKPYYSNQWWRSVDFKKTDPYTYLWRTWFYINFYKTFLSVLKISKTFIFFLKTSGEYSKIWQGSVFTTDPCQYLVRYSLGVLKKKTKVLDIFDTETKCFFKNNIETSNQEIWIRIRFLGINGSPSLI